MTTFFRAGYDVSGDTRNIAYAYIAPAVDGWQRGVGLELGEDAQLTETVDVLVPEGDEYTDPRIYRDGQLIDTVVVDGVAYVVYAEVAS